MTGLTLVLLTPTLGIAAATPGSQVTATTSPVTSGEGGTTAPTAPTPEELAARERKARERAELRERRALNRAREQARIDIRAEVVERGLAQVGDSYAAGAEGPDAFDCSGFTVYAWRGAGVELTHYSVAQYQQVERINPDRAQPGDLVFYLSRGARHVALYIGDGRIVHASDYGVGVIVSSKLGTPWTNTHFTGVGRVKIPTALVEQRAQEILQERAARPKR